MQEICYKEGLTFKFDYWFDPNTENEDHMIELTVFGSKNKISKIEKELTQPLCTDLNEDPNPFPHPEKKGGPFNPDSLKKY